MVLNKIKKIPITIALKKSSVLHWFFKAFEYDPKPAVL
jgi:hypothetical protein